MINYLCFVNNSDSIFEHILEFILSFR